MSYELTVVGFSADPVHGTGVKLRWTWPPAGFIGTLDPQFAILYIQRSTSTDPAVNQHWPLAPNFVDNVGTQLEPTPEAGWETIKIVEVPPQFMDNDVGNPWQFTNYNDPMQQPPAVTTYYRIVAFINTDPSPIYVELDWQPAFVEPPTVGPGGVWQWQQIAVVSGGLAECTPAGCVRDASGNTYVSGRMRNTNVNFGGGLRTQANGQSFWMFIVKYNSTGQYVWDRVIGNNGGIACEANGIVVDSAGDVYIAGSISTTNTVLSMDFGNGKIVTWTEHSNTHVDICVAKFSGADGSCQWVNKYDGPVASDFGTGIVIDSSNNIVVCGTYFGTVNFGGGARSGSATSTAVVKLDSSGGYIWDKTFEGLSGTFGVSGRGIAIDPSGDIVCAGIFSGSTDFGNGTVAAPAQNSTFFVKLLGTDGSWVLQKSVALAATWAVACDPITEEIIIVGSARNGCDFGNGPISASTDGGNAMFVVKYTLAGVLAWQVVHGGGQATSDVMFAVCTDSNARIYVTGGFQTQANNFGDGFTFGNGLIQYLVLALNSNGTFRWKFRPSGDLAGPGSGRAISARGGSVSVGSTFGTVSNLGNQNVSGGPQNFALANYST